MPEFYTIFARKKIVFAQIWGATAPPLRLLRLWILAWCNALRDDSRVNREVNSNLRVEQPALSVTIHPRALMLMAERQEGPSAGKTAATTVPKCFVDNCLSRNKWEKWVI